LALASTRLRASVQTVGVFGFAMVYLAAVWWLFQEAMRGVPVLRS
jgi:cbb3-type cytochrome oxidase subunit 3